MTIAPEHAPEHLEQWHKCYAEKADELQDIADKLKLSADDRLRRAAMFSDYAGRQIERWLRERERAAG